MESASGSLEAYRAKNQREKPTDSFSSDPVAVPDTTEVQKQQNHPTVA
jgi:hypothetical protein